MGVLSQKVRMLLFKLVKRLINTTITLLVIPLILVVRIIKPIVLIRFGKITSYIIGHFVFDTEYYLSEKNISGTNSLDFFFYHYKYKSYKKPPNDQWDRMVRRHLRVHPFVAYLYRVNQIIPGGQTHIVEMNLDKYYSRDPVGVLAQSEVHIIFTDAENERANLLLKEIGLESSDKFVCLNVRDSAYKEKYQNWKQDWSYHNYRDSDIDTYEEASLALAEKGYWVFRMGKAVHKPLKSAHPRIQDYANTPYRSDFLDIWLMANCFFCISTASGLDAVSNVFRRPIVFVNHIGPISNMVSWTNNLVLPKKLIWRNSDKYLSLSELLQHAYGRSRDYDKAGIRIIDSSPDEITEAVFEMEARLNGDWNDMEQDDQLQKLFWEKFKTWSNFEKYHGKIHPEARVGTYFLRKNPWFLN